MGNEPSKKKEKDLHHEKEPTSKITNPNLPMNIIPGSLLSDIRKVYKFKDVLGGGHFGSVRVAYRKNEEPRKYYAVKSISKKNLSVKDLADLVKEVDIISTLNHPNIIKVISRYTIFNFICRICTFFFFATKE